MNIPSLSDLIEDPNIEWYDHSTLSLIDECYRKGFWNKLFQLPQERFDALQIGEPRPGIANSVGPGALVGTCWHRALEKYYGLKKLGYTVEQRKFAAIRAYGETHKRLFPNESILETKHTFARNIEVLDLYCEFYRGEDLEYNPIHTELAGVVPILPRKDESHFEPILYVFITDGIFERLRYNDWVILETKTTGGGVDREAEKQQMSRQSRGYAFAIHQCPSIQPVHGVLANIIGIMARECTPSKLFHREYYAINPPDMESWRKETISKVLRWRWMQERAQGRKLYDALCIFDKNTESCQKYGRCTYYDLCLYGVTGVDLNRYNPNTWNPFTR